MSTQHTLALCPRCQQDQTAYKMMGAQPSFCLNCRFPLMLIANKYYAEEIIATGAKSTLYLARHHQLKRKGERVLKVLSSERLTSSESIQRFHREVQISSELSQLNEHIVRIYDDFGEIPYLGYFYVMEYLEGIPLDQYLLSHQTPLPIGWSLDIILQLCDALQTAHEHQVIHRDLKPNNLMMLEKPNQPLYLKVLDWGIAKALSEDHTALTQHAVGTPLYMAPEQVFTQQVDARTDIFSVGVLLFELLSGTNPIAAVLGPSHTNDEALLQSLHPAVYEQLPPLKRYAPREYADKELTKLVAKALSPDPRDRFQSIESLQEMLQHIVDRLQFALPSISQTQLGQVSEISLEPHYTPHSLEARAFAETDYFDKEKPARQATPQQTPQVTPPQAAPQVTPSREPQEATPLQPKEKVEETPRYKGGTAGFAPAQSVIYAHQSGEHQEPDDLGRESQETLLDQNFVELHQSGEHQEPDRHATFDAYKEAYPTMFSALFVWLGMALGLGVMLGLFFWFPKNKEKQPQTNATQETKPTGSAQVVPARAKTPVTPTPLRVIPARVVTAPPPPRAIEPLAPAPRRIAPPKRPSLALASRTRPPRRRKEGADIRAPQRTKTRTRRRKRLPARTPARPAAAGCAAPNIWVKVAPFLSLKSEVIAEGGSAIKQTNNGICLSATVKRVSIMQQGHALCIFNIRPKAGVISVLLQPEVGLQAHDYCLR